MKFNTAKGSVEAPAREFHTESSSGAIDWADYNFPPLLNLMHFSLAELQGGLKRFVLNLYISYIIVIAVLIINCIVD